MTRDAARCRNLLTDLTSGDETSARLLTIAVELGIASELQRTASPPGVTQARSRQLLAALAVQGLDAQSASYVLETWADSLNVPLNLDAREQDAAVDESSPAIRPLWVVQGTVLAVAGAYASLAALSLTLGSASVSLGALVALLWASAAAVALLVGAAVSLRNWRSDRRHRRLHMVGIVFVAVLALTPVLYWRGDLDHISSDAAGRIDGWLYTSEIRAPRRERVDAAELRRGDCLDELHQGGVAWRVSCRLPHTYEVLSVQRLQGPYRPPSDRACAPLQVGVDPVVAWPTAAQWQFTATRWSVCAVAVAGAAVGSRPRSFTTTALLPADLVGARRSRSSVVGRGDG